MSSLSLIPRPLDRRLICGKISEKAFTTAIGLHIVIFPKCSNLLAVMVVAAPHILIRQPARARPILHQSKRHLSNQLAHLLRQVPKQIHLELLHPDRLQRFQNRRHGRCFDLAKPVLEVQRVQPDPQFPQALHAGDDGPGAIPGAEVVLEGGGDVEPGFLAPVVDGGVDAEGADGVEAVEEDGAGEVEEGEVVVDAEGVVGVEEGGGFTVADEWGELVWVWKEGEGVLKGYVHSSTAFEKWKQVQMFQVSIVGGSLPRLVDTGFAPAAVPPV